MESIKNDLMLFYVVLFIVLTILVVPTVSRADEIKIAMDAIAVIESGNNALAVNPRDGSAGTYQITKICLQEWNNFHPRQQHSRQELFNPAINYKIANWYLHQRIPQMLRYYGHPVTKKNVIVAYNCGITCVIKGRMPPITKSYLRKYEEATR